MFAVGAQWTVWLARQHIQPVRWSFAPQNTINKIQTGKAASGETSWSAQRKSYANSGKRSAEGACRKLCGICRRTAIDTKASDANASASRTEYAPLFPISFLLVLTYFRSFFLRLARDPLCFTPILSVFAFHNCQLKRYRKIHDLMSLCVACK